MSAPPGDMFLILIGAETVSATMVASTNMLVRG
jgi:hypothetical protein